MNLLAFAAGLFAVLLVFALGIYVGMSVALWETDEGAPDIDLDFDQEPKP